MQEQPQRTGFGWQPWISASILLLTVAYFLWNGQWSSAFLCLVCALAGIALSLDFRPKEAPAKQEDDLKAVAADPSAYQLMSTCGRRIDSPIRNLNQVQGLVNGATTQLWTGLREIGREAQTQADITKALEQQLPQRLAAMRQQTESISSGLEGMIHDSAQSSKQILNVGDSLDEITAHLTLIERQLEALSWIADQTNLVAVNAQIEAARLGTQGKGFHVIAAEIQQLSKRARIVSEEISTHVMMATAFSEEALSQCSSASSLGIDAIRAGKQQLASMGDALEDVTHFVRKQIDKSTGSAEALQALSSRAMNYMQFEDITRQVLERSRADLMSLRDALTSSARGEDSALSHVFADYDQTAMHKPLQENLDPGEVELF